MISWPDNWIKLSCPNGHELQSYEQVHNGRVYGFCDTCGIPFIFSHVPLDVVPEMIPVPPPDASRPNYDLLPPMPGDD